MNKVKIILFDVDGVLIRPPYYFSKVLEKKGYAKAEESLSSFYLGNDKKLCAEGKLNKLKAIVPYLKKFGWTGTAGDYLKQQIQFERKYLDKTIITIIKRLKKQGIQCYLCTDQEKHRAKFLIDKMGFKKLFNKCFVSCYIGHRKCNSQFWKYVIDQLKKEFTDLKPSDIVYFDDDKKNIATASKIGIQAFLFKNINQFKKYII